MKPDTARLHRKNQAIHRERTTNDPTIDHIPQARQGSLYHIRSHRSHHVLFPQSAAKPGDEPATTNTEEHKPTNTTSPTRKKPHEIKETKQPADATKQPRVLRSEHTEQKNGPVEPTDQNDARRATPTAARAKTSASRCSSRPTRC